MVICMDWVDQEVDRGRLLLARMSSFSCPSMGTRETMEYLEARLEEIHSMVVLEATVEMLRHKETVGLEAMVVCSVLEVSVHAKPRQKTEVWLDFLEREVAGVVEPRQL